MECEVLAKIVGFLMVTLILHDTIDAFESTSSSSSALQWNNTISDNKNIVSFVNQSKQDSDGSHIKKPSGKERRHRKKSKTKPKLQRRQGGARKSCFKQTCQQTITGRNLGYQRALNLIQNEDYLTAADKDAILKYKRHKRSPEFKSQAGDPSEGPRNNEIFEMYKKSTANMKYVKTIFGSVRKTNQTNGMPKKKPRSRRQASQFSFLTSGYCGLDAVAAFNAIFFDSYRYCTSVCPSTCYVAVASFNLIQACSFDINCLTYYGYDVLVTDFATCIAATESTLSSLNLYFCPTTNATTAAQNLLAQNAPQAAAAIGVVGAAAFMSVPPLPMVTALGSAPGSATPALSAAGVSAVAGGLNPAFIGGFIAAAALLLVPLGLSPIAVFPPYITDRTIPAVSVIFAEDPNIMMLNNDVTLMRTRRDLVTEMRKAMRRNYRRPSVFSTLWNRLLDKFRSGRKKIKSIQNEIMCLRTKVEFLKMKIKQKIRENRDGKKTTTTTTTTEKVIYRITTQGPTEIHPNEVEFPESSEQYTSLTLPDYVDFNSTQEVNWVSNFNSQEVFEDDGSASGEFRPPATIEYFHNKDVLENLEANKLRRRRIRRQARKDKVMNSMDDCFTDMPEPKYGFRTMIMILEDEPCDLSSNCKFNSTEKIESRSDDYFDRQTGEDFAADGPTNCRVKLDTSASRC